MTRGDYTLGDLLNDTSLDLELLTGSDDVLLTSVAGAHAIEVEHPAKWIDAGWMMLTMGVRMRNKPQMQRDLIAELQELGASCLGFGVGLAFKSAPVALLDEARRRNFPVVLVPEETQFRDITRAVFQSTVGMESTTFQRLTSIQQNLLRAFADENPLESILQRLGRLVHATVAVVSLDCQVDAATGKIPVAEIAAGIAGQTDFPLVQLDIADLQIFAAPVTISRGPAARWLVVACRKAPVAQELARAAVQVTAPLIGALLRMSLTTQGQDRAIRKALLDSALDEDPSSSELKSLGVKIAALGIDIEDDHRTVVIRERQSALERLQGAAPREEFVAWIHERLESHGARYLLSGRTTEVVLVVRIGDPALTEMFDELVERWPTLTVGLGRRIGTAGEIRTSHRDAQISVQHLSVDLTSRVMSFDDLDVVTQLLAEVPVSRFAATAAPIAAMLAENPIQLEALRAYFAANRDVKVAADSIFLHPNTLRYRLERLEQALGRSLREPAVTASLYCVLTLMEDFHAVPPASDSGDP